MWHIAAKLLQQKCIKGMQIPQHHSGPVSVCVCAKKLSSCHVCKFVLPSSAMQLKSCRFDEQILSILVFPSVLDHLASWCLANWFKRRTHISLCWSTNRFKNCLLNSALSCSYTSSIYSSIDFLCTMLVSMSKTLTLRCVRLIATVSCKTKSLDEIIGYQIVILLCWQSSKFI